MISRDVGPKGKPESLRLIPILDGFEIHEVICNLFHDKARLRRYRALVDKARWECFSLDMGVIRY